MAKSLEDVQMLPLPNSKSKEREERSEEGEGFEVWSSGFKVSCCPHGIAGEEIHWKICTAVVKNRERSVGILGKKLAQQGFS